MTTTACSRSFIAACSKPRSGGVCQPARLAEYSRSSMGDKDRAQFRHARALLRRGRFGEIYRRSLAAAGAEMERLLAR